MVGPDTLLRDVLLEMTDKRVMTAVVDADGKLTGILPRWRPAPGTGSRAAKSGSPVIASVMSPTTADSP